MEEDVLDALRGLQEQATKERSHFYVRRTAERAVQEIEFLRMREATLLREVQMINPLRR